MSARRTGARLAPIRDLNGSRERESAWLAERGLEIEAKVVAYSVIKGRLAFEAPGPLMLVQAHRELTKLVHTRWQSWRRDQLGAFYRNLMHEGLYYDPVMRDLETFLDSTARA